MTDNLATRPIVPMVDFDPAETSSISHDPAVLARFYQAHYDELMRYVTRRLDSPHDVADLVADTFLTALDSARSYDPDRGPPRAWLLGIAHNLMRHRYRRQAADRRTAQRIAGRRLLADDDIARLEEQIDAARRVGPTRDLLATLSRVDRELLELIHLGGLQPQEAAALLGLRPGTARIRLFRARARLRAAWQSPEEDR